MLKLAVDALATKSKDLQLAAWLQAAGVPASLFRVYGGVLSDKFGARRVMYWTFGVSVLAWVAVGLLNFLTRRVLHWRDTAERRPSTGPWPRWTPQI